MTSSSRLGGAAALSVALILVGCQGGNPNAPARVTGKVTYNGSPVTGGSLTFHFKDGPVTVGINADGTYSAFDVPVGEAAVTVETESLNPNQKMEEYRGQGGGGGAGMAAKYGGGKGGASALKAKGQGMQASPAPQDAAPATVYMKIPEKYADPAKSGLSVTLEKGKQTKNFELTD